MKKILITISFIGLIMTILPSILVFAKVIEFEQHKWLMALGALAWFATAPFWMNKNNN